VQVLTGAVNRPGRQETGHEPIGLGQSLAAQYADRASALIMQVTGSHPIRILVRSFMQSAARDAQY